MEGFTREVRNRRCRVVQGQESHAKVPVPAGHRRGSRPVTEEAMREEAAGCLAGARCAHPTVIRMVWTQEVWRAVSSMVKAVGCRATGYPAPTVGWAPGDREGGWGAQRGRDRDTSRGGPSG